jgi:hypothetical protein
MNADTIVALLLEKMFSIRSVRSVYKEDIWGDIRCWLSVECPAVKRRLGTWCDMVASLGLSQLSVES